MERPESSGPDSITLPADLIVLAIRAPSPLRYLRSGGEAAEVFLGTQGHVWDTPWDIALAVVGAVTAQLMRGRRHDRELRLLGAC